jgi:hypothetical protein
METYYHKEPLDLTRQKPNREQEVRTAREILARRDQEPVNMTAAKRHAERVKANSLRVRALQGCAALERICSGIERRGDAECALTRDEDLPTLAELRSYGLTRGTESGGIGILTPLGSAVVRLLGL